MMVCAGVSQGARQHPATRDPYEARTVEVRESRVPGAGQGLFMRRPVAPGTVVAYFAGVVVSAQVGVSLRILQFRRLALKSPPQGPK